MSRLIQTDYVVVGSGIAGLTVSLFASRYGRVSLVTKDRIGDGNSRFAQGGIAAAIGNDDSPDLHRDDTLRTGSGLSDYSAVDTLVHAAPDMIRLLVDLGVPFDRDKTGELVLGREGAHGKNRIVHAGGDATGKAIVDVLAKHVLTSPRIDIFEHCYAAELIVVDGECQGLVAVDHELGPLYFQGKTVVLANGGLGQLYRYTTNDPGIYGSGYAMAYQAGAELQDMEFVQFHPTALKVDTNPMPLISEAVRGEGAVLVNSAGEAFMGRYHPWKDLASRDIVARAIFTEYNAGKNVYLDARSISHFAKRFPTITQLCKKHGIDPARDLIPVVPAAHYTMGGIKTDTNGRTTLPRLFAVGEVASSGVHGANRLASNSLLEGAAFARRTAEALAEVRSLEKAHEPSFSSEYIANLSVQPTASLLARVQSLMWEEVGLIREGRRLQEACGKIEEWLEEAKTLADRNLLVSALLVARAALWRRESRGSHFRSDYPEENNEQQRHSLQVKSDQFVFSA
ncbi:L-aspartate oxidase [Collibacillus ludicampi]|uniref:L-aspartate oxidase n=1 Tax=Collibacillus ludicampi TaxID=2771369 RepID=A0AAV4LDI1_9BACL|nr:L-aspartate oxidase [Collibacillus ludicampi]GIM45795.1 L-aspartate oxidase [Collibacillus ludicampi]